MTQGTTRAHAGVAGMTATTRIGVLKKRKLSAKNVRIKGTTKRHAEARPENHLPGTRSLSKDKGSRAASKSRSNSRGKSDRRRKRMGYKK